VPAWTIIDWSLPIQSIFDRSKPLAVATERRIAIGLRRFVLESASPFLMPITHTGAPRVHSLAEPLRTLTTAHRGEIALVAPQLVRPGHTGPGYTAIRAQSVEIPLQTLTGSPEFAVVAAWMAQHNSGATGHAPQEPLSTLTTRGTQQNLACAYLTKMRDTSTAASVQEPVPTLSAGGNHIGAVAAFLTKYYGTAEGQHAGEPLHALTTKGRFGVVTVDLHGETYAVADIGMRMLQPSEAAAAHELRLPATITVAGISRPLTKTESTRLIGNSVPKRLPKLLAQANAVHALQVPQRSRAA